MSRSKSTINGRTPRATPSRNSRRTSKLKNSEDELSSIHQTRIDEFFKTAPHLIAPSFKKIALTQWSSENAIKREVEAIINLDDSGEEISYKVVSPPRAINKKPASRKGKLECPPYKIIEDTTFAVDAFRFGVLPGVTHYFLTHFHADHYVGLTKKFDQSSIFMSAITSRLVSAFIKLSPKCLNVVELNEPIVINDIEVTALDANHCPGAVMFLFKFVTGKCILHTGDFRASPEMESEPIFWNNSIHTIYLDTTYLTSKYSFQPQCDSIAEVIDCVAQFQLKHVGVRILYVCGSYLIGKEKIWLQLATAYNLRVWTETNRRKALEAIADEEMLSLLTSEPSQAGIHVLPMAHLTHNRLLEYFDLNSEYFDLLLAFRPSGWEHNSRPQYRGKVNIVGVEYSEHSSYDDMRRFVAFLQPKKIISTVPVGHDLTKTAKIPASWYHNELRSRRKATQLTITSYMKTSEVKEDDESCLSLSGRVSSIGAEGDECASNSSNKSIKREVTECIDLTLECYRFGEQIIS